MSTWYYEVNDYLKTLSDLFNVELIKVCGIFSALSVNCSFKNCVRSTELFLKTRGNCKVSTYSLQKNKALKILNASKCTLEDIKAILGGLKTISFFDNLYRPLTSEEVTLDVHMFRLYKIKVVTHRRYERLAGAIRRKANKIGVRPHELQAFLWVQQRGESF